MNRTTTKTALILTAASAFVYVQGYGCGQYDNLVPSTIAATAATANSSISTVGVAITYNTMTDDPIEIAPPVRDQKSQT